MNEDQPEPESESQAAIPDPAITPDLYREWRSPRFGRSNPEKMNNPVWEWLVCSKLDAYTANLKFKGPSASPAGPAWCFCRMGQTSTTLPDGRTILVSGEHEDGYDPDFNIYNDVVVLHPDERIDIFGYPRDIFPPTDFHTATLVGDRIILIGNLGYPEDRKLEKTQVLSIHLDTFAISAVPTFGMTPGWIHKLKAELSDEGTAILIRGGKLYRGDGDGTLVENIDDWKLRLSDWRWERLNERHWPRWEIRRKDRQPNHLWEFRSALTYRDMDLNKEYQSHFDQLEEILGFRPDLETFSHLYEPTIPHETIPVSEEDEEEKYNTHRIRLNGITIRYVEDMYSIQMTVEGELPTSVIKVLLNDLVGRLSTLENVPYTVKTL